MTYRFVGSTAELGNGTSLERFGAPVELPEDEACDYIAPNSANPHHGAALLPDAEFQAIGFTDAELETYFTTSLHGDAPAEFQEKRDAAWRALTAHRERIIAARAAAKE